MCMTIFLKVDPNYGTNVQGDSKGHKYKLFHTDNGVGTLQQAL